MKDKIKLGLNIRTLGFEFGGTQFWEEKLSREFMEFQMFNYLVELNCKTETQKEKYKKTFKFLSGGLNSFDIIKPMIKKILKVYGLRRKDKTKLIKISSELKSFWEEKIEQNE